MPKRKCKHCKEFTEKFIKVPAGIFCDMEHAVTFAYEVNKKNRDKKIAKEKQEYNRETKRRKQALKSRSEWLKDCQQVFNKFIRERDVALPCVSCGRHHTGQYHAGHYRSVGAHPELRFNERNCHKQCSACNNHLSGNISNYRPNLIAKIGSSELERLEGPHEPKKYTVEELKELKKYYQIKLKTLQNEG